MVFEIIIMVKGVVGDWVGILFVVYLVFVVIFFIFLVKFVDKFGCKMVYVLFLVLGGLSYISFLLF